MSTVDVRTRTNGSTSTVALAGELDISGVSEVEEELQRVEEQRPDVLVMDLRELSFIDSSGLRLILEADLRARKEQRRLALVRGPDPVHRVFLIALLDKRLEFIDSPDELDGPSS